MVRGIKKIRGGDLAVCDICKISKLTQKPHLEAVVYNKGEDMPDLVVMDLAGPNKPRTLGGKSYDMVLVDTFSQRSFVMLWAKKSEAAGILVKWILLMENLTGKKLKRLRSDNGGEFMSNKFENWLEDRGSQHQTTSPYNPQSNGIDERMNRTLQDKARSMMLESKLPGSLWGEIMLTACVVRNLTPTSSLSKIPLEMWTGKKP